MPRISVITIVYNDVTHIRATMESFFAQTWEEKEYIVIDGGSTDGTAEIIREYADRLAFWCSERDGGIYDAMNKGISHCSGDWISILNCGDLYGKETSLADMMAPLEVKGEPQPDVIYGDSLEDNGAYYRHVPAEDPSGLEYGPTFRHGSALVKASVQKAHLFDLSKKKSLGYALDWEMLYRLYKEGYTFRRIDALMEIYSLEGVSNHPYRNRWLNYKVVSQGHFAPGKFWRFLKQVVRTWRKQSSLNKYLGAFMRDYMVNSVLSHCPWWGIRRWYLRHVGLKIGKGSFVMRKNYILQAHHLTIGEGSHINRGCSLDCRAGITIGNSVCISHGVHIMTGSHDVFSDRFFGKFKPIEIDDYAFIGVGSTILQGVHVGKGAVVSAGAVVTHDVAPFTIVGGVPAKEIGKRPENLDYRCDGWLPWT